MDIKEIVAFWRGQQQIDLQGEWTHRLDRTVLETGPHSFNLDHPVCPYIGDVINAPVIILNANAGYDADLTPTEFPDASTVDAYIARVDEPSGSDWSFVSQYYDDTNYGHLIASGKAVAVNACAYRSPKISNEKDNRRIIPRLPSAIFTRRWLLEAVLPMAAKGERLVVANRSGLWKLDTASNANGLVRDACPVSPRITGVALSAMNDFLSR
ncbi:hypothetical protein [Sphingopyxis terrae]|uniref:hypothetical protein n=1 Tax=Sphingopyxis terrae TaxID=33052 RepID=UPI000AADC9B2|nr:hypothetical protein [Sphingopyxis terrae]